MTEKAPIFEKIRKDYLHQVASIEAKKEVGALLGVSVEDGRFKLPFFNRIYTITPDGIIDTEGKTAPHGLSVILCKYLLLCPQKPSSDFELVTYKDFKDAAPYVGGFRNTAEQPIAGHFEKALSELQQKCLDLDGRPFKTQVSCDLAFIFQALPKIPIVLLFNDADEDFPAQATLLFQKNAASYLDMECLAMVGSGLAYYLQGR